MINVFQPQLGDEELEALRRVFASNWLGKGPVTKQFEAALAERFAVPAEHVRAVSCCTAGLFLIAELLGWGPGDEVVLPTISFAGAANAVAARGARPVFADVDERTLNLTADDLDAKLTDRTRAVILLHYGGLPCGEIDEITALCRDHGVVLIEDNACSPFSRHRGRSCGTLGDFGVWSFDAMKILVTGDGGLIYAKNAGDAERLERMAYLGLESASGLSNTGSPRWWEFEISSFGGRQITNDIASAMGLEQLKKTDAFLARRREVHAAYDREFAGLEWLTAPPAVPDHAESSYYLYWVQTERRDQLAGWLKEQGIYTTFRYYPLHRVERYGFDAWLPRAERAAETTLCLPLHQSLSDADVEHVVASVKRFADHDDQLRARLSGRVRV